METKELKIQAPEGYEIDKENSTFECIKFKSIKKDITYEDICNNLLISGYYINNNGKIIRSDFIEGFKIDKNNATNKKQLKRILALNQLLNIAEYYNRLHAKTSNTYTIIYSSDNYIYYASITSIKYLRGISAIFNRKEDAQAVIDNPNFREILGTIYKKSLPQFMNENRRDSAKK